MDVMSLGLTAFCILLISAWGIFYKKNLWGLFGSVAAIIMTVLSGVAWKKMLIDSGKDTALLGFDSYPAAVIILVLLLVCGAGLFIISAAAIAREAKSK